MESFALLLKAAAVAGMVIGFSSSAMAQNSCAAGKTLKEGTLTIATGEPAYFPWVIDNKPEDGKGFEAAVAVEIASRLGFPPEKVVWIRTTFDQAIQPGPKDFDFNLQQYSITDDRAKVVDFSTRAVREPESETGPIPLSNTASVAFSEDQFNTTSPPPGGSDTGATANEPRISGGV